MTAASNSEARKRADGARSTEPLNIQACAHPGELANRLIAIYEHAAGADTPPTDPWSEVARAVWDATARSTGTPDSAGVTEAAVEAAARAMHERDADAAYDEPPCCSTDTGPLGVCWCCEPLARTALTAALPHMQACDCEESK